MRKKTTSQIICQNFKIPPQTIFQDYKCTYRSSVTFFGRIYIGEEHFLFIANMFGIVKKCTIEINNVSKIQQNTGANSIIIAETCDGHEIQYNFGSFKNNNAYRLMRALWKGEKIGSDVLKPQNEEENQGSLQMMGQPTPIQILDDGNVQANFFNPQVVDSEKQKIVEHILPCSVDQFYDFFLADNAEVYDRKKHLEKRNSHSINVTEWRKSAQLDSEVREVTAMIKVVGVPFLNFAGMSQVFMLKRNQEKNQLNLKIMTQMADVPYCTYFNVEEHISVSSESSRKCKMVIEICIIFNKATSFKNTILKKTYSDFRQEYQLWTNNVKKALEDMKKKQEASLQKGKKVEVEYEQNLPVLDKKIQINEQKQRKEQSRSPLTLEDKVDLLIKLVGLLIMLNVVEVFFKLVL